MAPRLTREHCRKFVEEHLFTPKSVLPSTQPEDHPGSIGMELETFPFMQSAKHRFGVAPVHLHGENINLMELLVKVAGEHNGRVVSHQGDLTGTANFPSVDKIVFPDGDVFQFEPGGQIEISTAPCRSLTELYTHLHDRKALLDDLTNQFQIHFAQFGTNPWFNTGEIGNQLKKPRYQALEHYFDQLGPYGKQMMLQTGSLHINIDLGDSVSVRARRILATNLLVPFVTAIFAHSPVIGGTITGHMAHRSFLWQHLDPARTGILSVESISDPMDFDALVDTYLEKALQAPVIYIRPLDNRIFPKEVTMAYWMNHGVEGVWPGLEDFQNHVSLLFPEVRLKGYLEIRSVDAPPPGWEMAPVMFYCGLLYADQYLDKTLDLLIPHAARTKEWYAAAIHGLENDEVFSIATQLIQLAMDGFVHLPLSFKDESHQQLLVRFYEQFTSRRRTFADEQLETFISVHSFLS